MLSKNAPAFSDLNTTVGELKKRLRALPDEWFPINFTDTLKALGNKAPILCITLDKDPSIILGYMAYIKETSKLRVCAIEITPSYRNCGLATYLILTKTNPGDTVELLAYDPEARSFFEGLRSKYKDLDWIIL